MTSYAEESVWSTLWNFLPGLVKVPAAILVCVVAFNLVSNALGVAQSNSNYTYQANLVRSDNPTFGPKGSRVKLVYFVDYQCPVCASNNDIMKQIKEQYKDSVEIVYKHNPLQEIHANAIPAARASQAVHKQGKFFEYIDILFASQSEGFSASNLEKWARQVGVNIDQYNTDRASKAVADLVDFDKRDITESTLPASSVSGEDKSRGEATGTPTTVITVDDKIVDWWGGRIPIDTIKSVLDKKITETGGTPPASAPSPAGGIEPTQLPD